jgi:hypothetical protein
MQRYGSRVGDNAWSWGLTLSSYQKERDASAIARFGSYAHVRRREGGRAVILHRGVLADQSRNTNFEYEVGVWAWLMLRKVLSIRQQPLAPGLETFAAQASKDASAKKRQSRHPISSLLPEPPLSALPPLPPLSSLPPLPQNEEMLTQGNLAAWLEKEDDLAALLGEEYKPEFRSHF